MLSRNEEAELESLLAEQAELRGGDLGGLEKAELLELIDLEIEREELMAGEADEAPEESNTFLESVADVGGDILEMGGEALDVVESYTVAPTKSAIKTFADTGSPLEAGSAFAEQFGEDPATAPEGAEVARSLGVRDFDVQGASLASGGTPQEIQESLSEMPEEEQTERITLPAEEAVGVAIEMTADPLMILPVGKALTGIAKGTRAMVKGTGKIILTSSKTAQSAKKGVDFTNRTVRRTAKAMGDNLKNMFNPTQVKDWERLKDVLKKNDILPTDLETIPEALEFGERSSVSTGAKVLRQGPLGEERTKIFNEFLGSVDEAVDINVGKMADDVGGDAFRGGEQLIEGYNSAVKEMFDGAEVTYQNFNAISPDHMISNKNLGKLGTLISKIENRSLRLSKKGMGPDRALAKSLLDDMKALRNMDGSYQDFVDSMQSVGRSAFKKTKPNEIVPVDKKKMKEIYYEMRDIVQTEITAFDPSLGKKLQESNKRFNKYFSQNEGINKIIDGDPELIFNKLIKNGNVTNLRALKETMPAGAFDKVRATYLNTLIEKNATYGNISYAKTINNLERKRRMITEMFIDAPEVLRDFEDLLEIGKRTGDMIANPSGTDISKQFREFMSGVFNVGLSEGTLEASKISARESAKAKRLAKKLPKKPSRVKKAGKRASRIGKSMGRKYPQVIGSQRGLEAMLNESDDSQPRK